VFAGGWTDRDAGGAFDEDELDEDRQGPQAADLGDDDEYETVPCPACGASVSELAERCPHCGEWIVHSAGPTGRQRLVLVVIAALLIVLLLIWLL
jgi:hypothetical protein